MHLGRCCGIFTPPFVNVKNITTVVIIAFGCALRNSKQIWQ
jgi:hypothetical protein